MAFTGLFALFALTMAAAIANRRRAAEVLFVLGLVLSFLVFLHHATDTLAISL